jgi:hypothetical protein
MLLDRNVELAAVDAVGGSELNGPFKLFRVNVDGNDFAGTRHFGALDHC